VKRILGESRTIRELLKGSKYQIDYYQREYKWTKKQINELVEDLVQKFFESHSTDHQRSDVQNYGHYFLGSIIISDKDGSKFIIDGQQRLTSLTILLIFLNNLQKERGEIVNIDELIYSEKYSQKSFNINVDERNPAMEALYDNKDYDPEGQAESVVNIINRYGDIEECFPDELRENSLPYFIDWLIENVHLVEITAFSDDDAYTIFETMNDRGLSLTPTEMLKGYLLANIADSGKKTVASDLWKKRLGELLENGKDEDADFFKAWFRSQYAMTIRERKKAATPGDFDKIGTEFHRWIKEKATDIGTISSDGFFDFINHNFSFYARQYYKIRSAAIEFNSDLPHIYYIARLGFTQHYQLMLAPLLPTDSEELIQKKITIVGVFLDILLHRRLWNFRVISYSALSYSMFQIMKEIRGKSLNELEPILLKRLEEEKENFDSNQRYRVHQQNRKSVKNILARITDYIEVQSGMTSRYVEYVTSTGKANYEVEHIWANHPENHTDEFPAAADFQEYRNRIGGLLLLPKSFNASYGDLPYKDKLPHYYGQNLLAKSLDAQCYTHNPGFVNFKQESDLPFQVHAEFKKEDLDKRYDLYLKICEMIWNPEQLTNIAGS